MFKWSSWEHNHRTTQSTEKTHKVHIADRGHVSMCPYNMVHKPMPIPTVNILEAKAALDSEWKITETSSSGRVQTEQQSRGDTPSNIGRQASSLYHINRLRSSWELWIWRKSSNSTRGGVALRSDIVKDDSGNYAVFTATVLDVISRLLGCSGEASDAAGAYTKDEMKDAPELLHLSEEDYLKIWIRLPKAGRPQHEDSIDDPVVPVERNHFHWLDSLVGDALRNRTMGWNCLLREPYLCRKMRSFLSVYVEDMRMARSTQHMPKMWAKQDQRKSILYDPVSFFDQVYLGCTQRAAQVNNRNCGGKTESVLEADQLKYRCQDRKEKSRHHSLELTTWKALLKKCVESFCESVHKTVNHFFLDDHHVKKGRSGNGGETCQIFAVRLGGNACIWQELEDQVLFGEQARENWGGHNKRGNFHSRIGWCEGCMYTERPTHMWSFQRLCFQRHLGACAHTLSTFLVHGRIVKIVPSSHHCWLALLECNGSHTHDFDILCIFLCHILWRVDSAVSVGMNIPQANTSCEPNSEIDMVGRIVPKVDFEHDEEEKPFHMSGITLQLPASANVSSNNSACGMFQVSIRYRVRPGVNPSQVQYPSQGSPAVPGPRARNCSIGLHTRSSEWSARSGSTCFASSPRRRSRWHSSIRSGCEAKSCQCSGKGYWRAQL